MGLQECSAADQTLAGPVRLSLVVWSLTRPPPHSQPLRFAGPQPSPAPSLSAQEAVAGGGVPAAGRRSGPRPWRAVQPWTSCPACDLRPSPGLQAQQVLTATAHRSPLLSPLAPGAPSAELAAPLGSRCARGRHVTRALPSASLRCRPPLVSPRRRPWGEALAGSACWRGAGCSGGLGAGAGEVS